MGTLNTGVLISPEEGGGQGGESPVRRRNQPAAPRLRRPDANALAGSHALGLARWTQAVSLLERGATEAWGHTDVHTRLKRLFSVHNDLPWQLRFS